MQPVQMQPVQMQPMQMQPMQMQPMQMQPMQMQPMQMQMQMQMPQMSGAHRGLQPVAPGQIRQEIKVPVHIAGNIIGRGGSIIKQIMEQSGAHIQMEQQNEMLPGALERGVVVTGTPMSVNRAMQDINAIVSERSGGQPQVNENGQETMSIPIDAVGRLIGTGGTVIKQLIAHSGAHIKFQQKEEIPYGSTHREVFLIGTPSTIEKAKKMITEIMATEGTPTFPASTPGTQDGGMQQSVLSGFHFQEGKKVIVVPDRKVGSLIGRGGCIIKKLMADSRARIQIQQKEDMRNDEREVTLTGAPEALVAAEQLITDLLEGNTAYGSAASMTAYSTPIPAYGAQQQYYQQAYAQPYQQAYGTYGTQGYTYDPYSSQGQQVVTQDASAYYQYAQQAQYGQYYQQAPQQ
jgi:polyribonucleotide nucleotidyltransferase